MSEIRVDKISGKTSVNAITVTGKDGVTHSLQQGLASTILNFNQETQTIVNSFNISGTVDNGTGDSTISYSNSYTEDDNDNALYVFCILGVYKDGTQAVQESYGNGVMGNSFSKSDAQMRFRFMHVTSNVYDLEFVNVLIHGDLA